MPREKTSRSQCLEVLNRNICSFGHFTPQYSQCPKCYQQRHCIIHHLNAWFGRSAQSSPPKQAVRCRSLYYWPAFGITFICVFCTRIFSCVRETLKNICPCCQFFHLNLTPTLVFALVKSGSASRRYYVSMPVCERMHTLATVRGQPDAFAQNKRKLQSST